MILDTHLILEYIGYAASLLIAVSLMMRSLIRLRILNGIGALVFVIYGLLIKAYPIAVLNGFIVCIDIYYLVKMLRRSEYFSLMEVAPRSAYLHFFLDFHAKDIQTFFPSFLYQPQPGDLIFFILRDMIPAGLIILRPVNNTGEVLLDYALMNYRDLKIGSFIFDDNADMLLAKGINMLEAKGEIAAHVRYLRRMGYEQNSNGLFHRNLNPHIIHDRKF